MTQKKLPLINSAHGSETRNIINELIKLFNQMGYTYDEALRRAQDILEEAKQTNDMNVSVQDQLNRLVIESGNANAEVSQARGYNDLLYQRLDGLEKANFETDRKRSFDSLVSKKVRKPMITWIDDDGNAGFYEKLMPLAREYDITMTSAVITNRGHGFPIEGSAARYDRYYSYEQMKEMQDEGIAEFVCHTHTHDINNKLTDMTVEEMHEELKTNQEIMKKLEVNYKHLVYPFGAFNDEVISVVKQYFDSAFRVGGDGGNAAGNIVEDPFDQFAINRVGVDGDITAAQVIEMIDKAYENNSWIVLTSHVDQSGGLDMQKARDIIEHALSLGMEFVTVEEGVNLRGNLAQTENFTISSDSKIYSDVVGKVQYAGNAGTLYPPNGHPDNYPTETIVYEKVTRALSSTLKLTVDILNSDTYGFMKTFGNHESNYVYQEFYSVPWNKKYYRRWDGNDWTKWESEQTYNISRMKYDTTSDLGDFPNSATTIFKVTTQHAMDNGLPHAGTIKMQRDSEPNYSYQEYTPHRTASYGHRSKLIRYWNNGQWGEWEDARGLINVHLEMSADDPITEFKKGAYTNIKVRGMDAEGYGLSGYGVILVYRDLTEDVFSYQEYVDVTTGNKKIRRWGNGKWDNWF